MISRTLNLITVNIISLDNVSNPNNDISNKFTITLFEKICLVIRQ